MTDEQKIEVMAERDYDMQEAKQEHSLRTDYEAFYDYTEKQREEAVEAVRHLQSLYLMYDWDFDIREFGSEL